MTSALNSSAISYNVSLYLVMSDISYLRVYTCVNNRLFYCASFYFYCFNVLSYYIDCLLVDDLYNYCFSYLTLSFTLINCSYLSLSFYRNSMFSFFPNLIYWSFKFSLSLIVDAVLSISSFISFMVDAYYWFYTCNYPTLFIKCDILVMFCW